MATFERAEEASLWFPVLEQCGFADLRLATDRDDQQNAIDAIGWDLTIHDEAKLALLHRYQNHYLTSQLTRYKREFSIRYARPSGVPVEWNKFFEMDLPRIPDYMAYGWVDSIRIGDYVIFDMSVLKLLYDLGHLDKYRENQIQNMNSRQSIMVTISIPELLKLPESNGLIFDHSDNHPGIEEIVR